MHLIKILAAVIYAYFATFFGILEFFVYILSPLMLSYCNNLLRSEPYQIKFKFNLTTLKLQIKSF
uniref:Uncharacterized protein n=1 Tax=Meloidogyne enterolobii TaxID=390850 RepID=A0A6V7UHI4_MELEN|nr:unnamed protein product [Meloidogyne enterolobii]